MFDNPEKKTERVEEVKNQIIYMPEERHTERPRAERLADGKKCQESAKWYIEDAKGEDGRFDKVLQENPKGKLRKKAAGEAKGIRDRNTHIISHLSESKEIIADAITAKQDEMVDYIKEHGGGPDSPSWDKKAYSKLCDEREGLKKSYNEISYHIDKLSINNKDISGLLGEKASEVNADKQILKQEQHPVKQKIKDFFLERLQKS